MVKLDSKYIPIMNSALSKLTGFKRRSYAAELCEAFFNSSPRVMEGHLKVSRAMVELGLNERRTGIRCLDNYSGRGAKKRRSASKFM